MTVDKEDGHRNRIQAKVSRTMESLDHVPLLAPSEHFTDSVMAASASVDDSWWEGLIGAVLSRRLAFALVTIFLLANIATVWIAMSDLNRARTSNERAESLASEYGLEASNSLASTATR